MRHRIKLALEYPCSVKQGDYKGHASPGFIGLVRDFKLKMSNIN